MRYRALLSVMTFILSTAAVAEEPPYLADRIAAGALPPLAERLPDTPSVVTFDGFKEIGRYGGQLNTLMSKPRDTRLMVVYGYARLVTYDPNWELTPDLLESIDVERGRVFTLHLRPDHNWSDGHPFTTEDFRFYWEDVANNEELSPAGPPRYLLVDGSPPMVEVIDETTIRYSWEEPNPFFLSALAGARPEYLYKPAHYMKQFHPAHTDEETLNRLVAETGQRAWSSLFTDRGRQYRNDNPDLPTLQPWVLTTEPPSTRFLFERNPYYHRVDPEGRQLPYIDTVAFTVTSAQLIPSKTQAGDSDLQARGLSFENFTILKKAAERNNYAVHFWRSAHGSELALYPNLTTIDDDWRTILRDVRFRRAMSLAIDRDEINNVVYKGFARPGNNTILQESPLFKEEYARKWATFDPQRGNALLDEMGFIDRDGSGIRLRPNGEPLEIVIETAGESPTQVAILQLIRDSWQKVGVKLFIKPQQREVLRNRVFSGTALMSVWFGLENGLATPMTPPRELAPTSQQQLQWPRWGQYYQTRGMAGEPIDMPSAKSLFDLYRAWRDVEEREARAEIWHQMLSIRADNLFDIGTVRAVPQPVVVSNRLRNVPEEGIYNWEPGAHFGIYRPDTFWFAK